LVFCCPPGGSTLSFWGGGGFAGLNDLTDYAGRNFLFLVGPPKQDRPEERDQTKRDKLVLQAWEFCGWVGNPPKENKSTHKQRRTALETTTLKEWTIPDCRNTPSTTNLEEEETVDAPGNDCNVSIPEQVKRPNPWKKKMMMMMFYNRGACKLQKYKIIIVNNAW